MRRLKIKIYPGYNAADFCAKMLVYSECLVISRDFKLYHHGYITYIFEDTSDFIILFCVIQKNKYVIEFINKHCLCTMYVIQTKYIITYESLVKEDICEYHNLVDSKQWDTTSVK